LSKLSYTIQGRSNARQNDTEHDREIQVICLRKNFLGTNSR
jgi:hypothetical protein